MSQTISRLTTFCFLAMGFWLGLPTAVVSWVAIEDLLSGRKFPSSIILLMFSSADMLSKLLSPFIVRHISFLCSMITQTILLVGSYSIIVLMENIVLRLTGVVFLGAFYGFSVAACYRIISYYNDSEALSRMYKLGSNMSSWLAALWYTGFTTWFCVAPRMTLTFLVPFCFLPLLFYAILDKTPLRYSQDNSTVKYQKISSSTPKQSRMLKLYKTMIYAIYIFIGNLCLQLTISSILTTLTFPNAPFQPRDHYQYYRLLSDAGLFLGGIENLLVVCVSHRFIEALTIHRIWIPVTLNVACTLLSLFASWYRFLPSVYIVFALVVIQGTLHGTTSVNCIG